MKGISPLIASVLLIAITMTLAAILATFVSNYTRQQLSALPSCVGGTLVFATSDYPKYNSSTTTISAILEAENVNLVGFTIEAIDSTGNVKSFTSSASINAGSSGTVSNSSASGIAVGNKARFIAVNCPTVKTDWVSLK